MAAAWQVWGALIWLLLFCGLFFQFDLPNSSPKVNRMELLRETPNFLMDLVDPPPPNPVRNNDPRAQESYRNQLAIYQQTGWQNFPQRIPYIAWGSLILAGAWSLGRLCLTRFPWHESVVPSEKNYLAFFCGMSLLSLLVLIAGLAGLLQRGLWIGLLGGIVLGDLLSTLRHGVSWPAAIQSARREWWKWLPFLPFAMCFLLGALLPETDFDAKEYHLGGPKEWYLAGRIVFLPHDVYTSFPFLVEMQILLGMIVTGDWYWGMLSGKFVLVAFAPLTAWGIYLAGKRWFSPTAGWIAAFLYFTTPWVYRFSTLTGVEGGLTSYLFASLTGLLLIVALKCSNASMKEICTLTGVTGFLSGSAMACKYPGLVSVIVPTGFCVLWICRRSGGNVATSPASSTLKGRISIVGAFILGIGIAIGPWLLKNVAQTGNPVYPLGYTIFGGVDWNPEMNEKWRKGHSSRPEHYTLGWLGESIKDVTMKSDWQSPLLFSLAPLAFVMAGRRKLILGLWLLVVYEFLTYWWFTHRIDRFWVPLIPVVALLAGQGSEWTRNLVWRIGVWGILIVVTGYHLVLISSPLTGYNAYLLDLKVTRASTMQITNPDLVFLNQQLPKESKVLFVGEAQLFDAVFPYEYNTVFDQDLLEQWTAQKEAGKNPKEWDLRPAKEIQQLFREHGFTHLCVNWAELLRYRLTYGYTDYVTRERILRMKESGILGDPLPGTGVQLLSRLAEHEQKEIREWSPMLIFEEQGQTLIHTFEVFPVLGN